MVKKGISKYYITLFFVDFLFLLVSLTYLLFVKYKGIGLSMDAFFQIISRVYIKEYSIILVTWILLSGYSKIYNYVTQPSIVIFFRRILVQISLFVLVVISLFNNEENIIFIAKKAIIYPLLIILSYGLSSRLIFFKLLKNAFKKDANQRQTIVIGYNENVDELIKNIQQKKELNFHLNALFTNQSEVNSPLYQPLKNLDNYLEQNRIDYVFIGSGDDLDHNQVQELIKKIENSYIGFAFVPNTNLDAEQNLEINYLDSFPILTLKKNPLDNPFNLAIKRLFDIVFTLAVFVTLLWWLIPIISLLVFLTQGRPIFFAQKRNGLNGEEFDCLKFRTMIQHKNNSLKPTERNDPRVTKLGKILRKTSLDELPQFFNVLKGEMSIVGPRPHMVSENETYSRIIQKYAVRHHVKPGITGLAQTKGYRGAIDSDLDMEMRIRADIYYVRNWSFLLDLLIIYRTVKLMIFGDENAI